MKLLHTADWHLADRLGRIDRTDDLRRSVECIADYCRQESVDVLLVAGDLFSELARPDGLRDAIMHLQETFARFLAGGGTILTLTGNHDNENFCRTLRHAMSLAAPTSERPGEVAAPGRLYLAADPSLLRLHDRRHNRDVQFLLMPYPTPASYLRDAAGQRYTSLEEKNRQLLTAFTEALAALRADPTFDPNLPAVLAAHVTVQGGLVSPLFRISEQEDVVFADADVPAEFAYVALGHIHKPQSLAGREHVRYCGSIERLDLGEKLDEKGCVLFELGPSGQAEGITTLPLPATSVYEVMVQDPATALPVLREQYADARTDLVNVHLTYTAGVDNLDEVLRELELIFPRWYSRDWQETGSLGPSLTIGEARTMSFEETVREYLTQELQNHADDDRAALMERAEVLMREE